MADIIETLRMSGSFNALNTALQAAGLIETLQEPGPFTVFAPTDNAFLRLPEDVVGSLFQDQGRLKDILLYHVLDGEYLAEDILDAGEDNIESVQGQDLMIDTSNGVKINGSNVIESDILCENGVIHAIDVVLIPLPVRAEA